MTPEDPPTDDEKDSKDVTEYSGTIEIPNLSEENEPEEIDVSVLSHVFKFVRKYFPTCCSLSGSQGCTY